MNKKKYYKIIRGYGAEEYLEIDETELEKAYYCFLEKKDSIFSGGAVKGSAIIAIQPDYHRAMGWNRGYELQSLDYADLSEKDVDKKHQNYLSETKDKVQYLISTNQTHLIGKNVDIPKSTEAKQISDEAKKLGDKFRIKS